MQIQKQIQIQIEIQMQIQIQIQVQIQIHFVRNLSLRWAICGRNLSWQHGNWERKVRGSLWTKIVNCNCPERLSVFLITWIQYFCSWQKRWAVHCEHFAWPSKLFSLSFIAKKLLKILLTNFINYPVNLVCSALCNHFHRFCNSMNPRILRSDKL